jgi:hypothetical protein
MILRKGTGVVFVSESEFSSDLPSHIRKLRAKAAESKKSGRESPGLDAESDRDSE